jgi:predicted transcriptional regulator
MTRLTITLDDALHQALKEAAARQGRSIGKIIEEGLLLRGIKPMTSARDLVARARQQAGMDEADAIALAVEETRRHPAREERAPDSTAA